MTTVQGGGGYTAVRDNQDGSQTTLTTTRGQGGRSHVSGFTSRRDERTGGNRRTYTDGSQVVEGNDFVTGQTPSGYSETTYDDGRREARWGDGRPIYSDSFEHRRDRHGRTERFIKRAVVATVVAGALVALAAPLIQNFASESVNGVDTYTYQPEPFDQPVYETMSAPLPAPVPVVAGCMVCPPPVVVYQQPVTVYREPAVLLTDMQIATAMNDGMTIYAPPAVVTRRPVDPQVQALQAQVASLQQEVASATATNQELQAQMADQQMQTANLQAQTASLQAQQVQISEGVRQQIRQQVSEELALHQQNRSLTLSHVMASPQALNYIFQVSGVVETADVTTGQPVLLTTGDLIKFHQVPGPGEVAAMMAVVASKSQAVEPGAVVMVGLNQLQEMLNAFSIRLEGNMRKVADYAGQGGR